MGDCYSPAAIANFASKDNNRIVGEIMKATARRSPYMDVLETGTIDNQMGSQFRSVIQNRTVVSAGLTVPTFIPVSNICRTRGGVDKTGTQEYVFQEGVIRGESQEICVSQAKQAFKRSWITASASLRDGFVKLKDADIRGQLFVQSGVKASVIDGTSFYNSVNGDQNDINTSFVSTLPNAFLTWKFVKQLANHMYDNLMAEPFETEQGTMTKLIGSRDLVDRIRDEQDIRADLRAFVTGKYKIGEEALDSFTWDGPYRGIGMAVDPRPLRAAVGGGGPTVPGTSLQLVEPEIAVATTNGVRAATNPAWMAAGYELASLHFANSFRYLAGQNWLGEGDVEFPNALAPTTMEFVNIRDNDCNKYADMGNFIYQINRGYEPERPSNVAFILYRRCNLDLDLAACNSTGNLI